MNVNRVNLFKAVLRLLQSTDKISSLDLPGKDGLSGGAIPWRLNGHTFVHPLHRMASRVGGFPPQLPRYFIQRFTKRGDLICDPFCGKGTTLLEAVSLRRKALGCDIGPDAVIISRAKTNWPSLEEILPYVEQLPRDGVKQEVPVDVKLFFHPKTLEQILAARERILTDRLIGRGRRRQLAEFTMGVLLGCLHGRSRCSLSLPSNHAFAMSPRYVRKYAKEHNLKCPKRDVRECIIERILMMLPGPRVKESAHVFEDDGKKIGFNKKGQWSGRVNLIITSPPYLARQTYIKDSWLRLWLLGRDSKAIKVKSLETGNIVRFTEMMQSCLGEFLRLLRPNGRCLLVCGTSHCDLLGEKTKVRIAGLVMYAAMNVTHEKYKWHIENLIEDKIVLKRGSYFAVRSNGDIDDTRRRISEDDIVSLVKIHK
ncbi:MAG: DNA methyltransferase [Promethearchaeota archaeon]